MATKPTTVTWATDAGTRAVPIPASIKATGAIPFHPLGSSIFNGLLGLLTDWVNYFASTVASYDKLEDAVAALVAGDTCIVNEYDYDTFPGERVIAAGGVGVDAIDATGKSVVYVDTAQLAEARSRANLTDVLATYTTAAVATVARIRSDGVSVIIASGTIVELFDHDAGGAPTWTYDHTATVNDCCMDATRVYIACNTAGAIEVRALNRTNGAVLWSYQHNGNVEAICTNGRQVFISGLASGHASLATMRSIDAENGFDESNEGGTGQSTSGMTWDSTYANPPLVGGLQTDGDILAVWPNAAVAGPLSWSAQDGTQIAAGPIVTPLISKIAIDHRYIYQAHGISPSIIYALDKRTMARAWAAEVDTAYVALASDGQNLFAAATLASSAELAKFATGTRVKTWHRVDPSTKDYLPYKQLIIPEE